MKNKLTQDQKTSITMERASADVIDILHRASTLCNMESFSFNLREYKGQSYGLLFFKADGLMETEVNIIKNLLESKL